MKGTRTYKIFVPEVLGIVLVSLVSCVSKDSFNLIILFFLHVGVNVIAWIGLVELLKIFNVVGIVGHFHAPTGGPQLVPRNTGSLLLLGPSAVLGV